MEHKCRGGVLGRVVARGVLGAALPCLLAGGAASADLTLDSRVTLTTNGRPAPARKLVTYYKGSRLRTETGSTATIYDTAAGRVIHIDRTRMTYMVLSQKQRSKVAGALGGLKFKASASVKPGAGTRVI